MKNAFNIYNKNVCLKCVEKIFSWRFKFNPSEHNRFLTLARWAEDLCLAQVWVRSAISLEHNNTTTTILHYGHGEADSHGFHGWGGGETVAKWVILLAWGCWESRDRCELGKSSSLSAPLENFFRQIKDNLRKIRILSEKKLGTIFSSLIPGIFIYKHCLPQKDTSKLRSFPFSFSSN